jgi:hypothetical protein
VSPLGPILERLRRGHRRRVGLPVLRRALTTTVADGRLDTAEILELDKLKAEYGLSADDVAQLRTDVYAHTAAPGWRVAGGAALTDTVA